MRAATWGLLCRERCGNVFGYRICAVVMWDRSQLYLVDGSVQRTNRCAVY